MLKKLTICLALIAGAGACTKDFEKINVNPNAPSNVPVDYLLGQSQLLLGEFACGSAISTEQTQHQADGRPVGLPGSVLDRAEEAAPDRVEMGKKE